MTTYGVHRLDNGNTLVGVAPSDQFLSFAFGGEMEEEIDSIREVDENGDTVWEVDGFTWIHDVEMMPDGNIAGCSATTNELAVINYTTKEIEWKWRPIDIDWSCVNSEWDQYHYYNMEDEMDDWAHTNDVDFKDYGNWTGCLISNRQFNIILEINYTSAKTKDEASAEDIVWYYGDYGETHVLNHQHDPNYLSNGNVMIADSDNHRVIEVNYTTKKVEWSFDDGLGWCREADEMSDGRILIGDDDEVLIVDKDTKDVEWRYNHMVLLVYDCDELDNGNILISNNDGYVVEVDPDTNEIVWEYNIRWIPQLLVTNGVLMMLLGTALIAFTLIDHKKKELFYIDIKKWSTVRSWILISAGLFVLGFGFLFIFYPSFCLVWFMGFMRV
jgi:hypothetical protein